ncbi:MAG TPA: hypothetical protein VEA79_13290, partial [Phenylobacterium sp.]|nr:hypothetical protein [Phenylobacterium sp.]
LSEGSLIASVATRGSSGDAGRVTMSADRLTLTEDATVQTSTRGLGDAGDVRIAATEISLSDGGGFLSNAEGLAGGRSGSVSVAADSLAIGAGGLVETTSLNPNPAGAISIVGRSVTVDGAGGHVSSENLSSAGGPAGSISIAGEVIRIANGGLVSTNSTAGRAGDITLSLPSDGFLFLTGEDAPGVITTSSGPGTGGRITIGEPYAVISDNGRILALGQAGGANVAIQSQFFIRSADRLNLVSVDGSLVIDSQIDNVSSGVAAPDVSFLDASSVLRGQCPPARLGGAASQLSLRALGPLSARPAAGEAGAGGPAPGSACR